MKLSHFDALRPVCPACRTRGADHALTLHAEAGDDDAVTAGVLTCMEGCGQSYPIIEGIPILMPDLPAWLGANLHLVLQADIAGAAAEAVVGALAGPDSAFNIVRQQQSTYGHAHYGDLSGGVTTGAPGSVGALVQQGLGTTAGPAGPVLDAGCAVGGGTFAMCERTEGVVLGIDVNWPLLKVAHTARDTGIVTYPLRTGGLAYERRSGRLACERRENADFWVADALALPFAAGRFAQVISLNVIDCVPDPARLVHELARALKAGGRILMTTPFDWASHATPPHLWIGDQDGVIALMKAAGLSTAEVQQGEWKLRLHALSEMTYQVKFFLGANA